MLLSLGLETPQLSALETQVWQRVRPAVATLVHDGVACGTAALIDGRGLYLAHLSSVPARQLDGKLAGGNTVSMTLVGQDRSSQLVLLRADNAQAGDSRPVQLATGEVIAGSPLIAVLSTGPIRAEYVSGNRLGVLQADRRALPMCEVRFELPPDSVGGALLFTGSGEFLGAVGATLGAKRDESPSSADMVKKALENLTSRSPKQALFGRSPGPARLTVAYAVSPDVLRRIIEGFQSPSGEVTHPALGVFCTDTPEGGALVQEVTRGSTAEQAGIRRGDIIQDIGGKLIRTQMDFATVMFRQKIGARIPIRIKRGSTTLVLDVVVGKHHLQP